MRGSVEQAAQDLALLTKLQVELARQSSSRLGKPGPGVIAPGRLGQYIRFNSRSTWSELRLQMGRG